MIVSKPEQLKDLPPGTYVVTGEAAVELARQYETTVVRSLDHFLAEHQRNRRIQKVKRK